MEQTDSDNKDMLCAISDDYQTKPQNKSNSDILMSFNIKNKRRACLLGDSQVDQLSIEPRKSANIKAMVAVKSNPGLELKEKQKISLNNTRRKLTGGDEKLYTIHRKDWQKY